MTTAERSDLESGWNPSSKDNPSQKNSKLRIQRHYQSTGKYPLVKLRLLPILENIDLQVKLSAHNTLRKIASSLMDCKWPDDSIVVIWIFVFAMSKYLREIWRQYTTSFSEYSFQKFLWAVFATRVMIGLSLYLRRKVHYKTHFWPVAIKTITMYSDLGNGWSPT